MHTAQNTVFKNHPREIFCDENHLYGMILLHLTSNNIMAFIIKNTAFQDIELKNNTLEI